MRRPHVDPDEPVTVSAHSGIGRDRASGLPVAAVQLALVGGELDGRTLGAFPPAEVRRLGLDLVMAADAAEHDLAVVVALIGGHGWQLDDATALLGEVGRVRGTLDETGGLGS